MNKLIKRLELYRLRYETETIHPLLDTLLKDVINKLKESVQYRYKTCQSYTPERCHGASDKCLIYDNCLKCEFYFEK